jgi:hypothetical protein
VLLLFGPVVAVVDGASVGGEVEQHRVGWVEFGAVSWVH